MSLANSKYFRLRPGSSFSVSPSRTVSGNTGSGHRRQHWTVLLKKVWDIDALKCPKCGEEMTVISFIEQPSVIRCILEHLDLREDPRPPPQPMELVYEAIAVYVPWKDDIPEIEVELVFSDPASEEKCVLMRCFRCKPAATLACLCMFQSVLLFLDRN